MKHLISFTQLIRWTIPALVAVVAIGFTSCKDDETTKAAPTVTVATATASNTAGSKVTTSVTIDSPEGGKKLSILVNGQASTTLPDVTLDGTTSQTVNAEFTIPATATVGGVYVITFQASDVKDQLSGVGIFTVTVSAVASKQIVDVSGNITTNTTWTADKIYRINGFVRVGTDAKPSSGTVEPVITSTAVLTIEAGTVIYGKKGTPGGTLIVQRGSQIIANGTAAKPIVFTSDQTAGTRKAGDWGGVVICGKAKNNFVQSLKSGSTGVEGVEELEGAYGGFHGGGGAVTANDADNSGSLKYVRIEFAGYPINPNQEINGLTLGSVGSGTTLDYIQIAYSNDDSFEWFGGAVNASHLVAYKTLDDDFDTDNGFSGNVSFGLAIRDANTADQSGSNGFESDNNAQGFDYDPKTSAKFSNMTILGGKATAGTGMNIQFQHGAQIRRNSEIDITKSIITGFPTGIYIDGQLPANATTPGASGSVTKANAGSIVLTGNILAGVEGWGGNGFGSAATADEMTAFGFANAGSNHANNPRGRAVAAGAASFTNGVFAYNAGAVEQQISSKAPVLWFKDNNTLYAKYADTGINANAFEPLSGTPTLLPTASSPLATGSIGAFTTASADWTLGWVNWNPQVTDYSK